MTQLDSVLNDSWTPFWVMIQANRLEDLVTLVLLIMWSIWKHHNDCLMVLDLRTLFKVEQSKSRKGAGCGD